jgi:4,5-dihydroxyphthalate decarboxylase
MSDLTLSFGVSSNPRTWPLIQGRVKPEGIDPIYTVLHPSELFWRQLKFGEFDVAELSMSTWMRLVARGEVDMVAIPVFTTRRFFHTEILVRADAGITEPGDLKGKRVGVPEYQQTAALWGRGVLEHEFGVKPSDMTFWMERTPEISHGGAGGFAFPAGVTINQIPAEKNIGTMMLAGELDATLLYITDRNLVDRSRIDLWSHPDIRPLFDGKAEGRRYYAKTGIFPINHLTVIKRSVFDRYPWVALNVYRAFQDANAIVKAERLAHTDYYIQTGLLPADAEAALETQLVEHGVRANRLTVETAAAYSHEQGLTPRRLTLPELFAPATLEL